MISSFCGMFLGINGSMVMIVRAMLSKLLSAAVEIKSDGDFNFIEKTRMFWLILNPPNNKCILFLFWPQSFPVNPVNFSCEIRKISVTYERGSSCFNWRTRKIDVAIWIEIESVFGRSISFERSVYTRRWRRLLSGCKYDIHSG